MKFKWDWPQYDPATQRLAPFDWSGKWRNRHEQVTGQGPDTKTGERQWLVRCGCGNQYSVTETQVGDNRVILCPNSSPRMRRR
jgi:hypothetical protein